MQTNNYEMTLIFDPTLGDDAIDREIEKIESMITDAGGEIEGVARWGRRRLAYPIRKRSEGFYCLFRFTSPRVFVRELDHELRLAESVIRHLVIVRDPRDTSDMSEPDRGRARRGESEEKRETTSPSPETGSKEESAPGTQAAEAPSAGTDESDAEPAEPAEESAKADGAADDSPAAETTPQKD